MNYAYLNDIFPGMTLSSNIVVNNYNNILQNSFENPRKEQQILFIKKFPNVNYNKLKVMDMKSS